MPLQAPLTQITDTLGVQMLVGLILIRLVLISKLEILVATHGQKMWAGLI